MASSISNSSLARSRSLRGATNSLKPITASTPQISAGPSNITLFLTNLRLLDLDLRDDWPDITALTFSTKDSQQNQKKRIQCVEWALYQLFAIWDPEETRNVFSNLAFPISGTTCILTNAFYRNSTLSSHPSNPFSLSTFAPPSSDVSTKQRRMEFLEGTLF